MKFSNQIYFQIFTRGLGAIFCIAFLSLYSQILGLMGENGIQPIAPYFQSLSSKFTLTLFYQIPSIYWFHAGDLWLELSCLLGAFLGILIVFGMIPKLALLFSYILYLSLIHAGNVFMTFQWDILLLETAFWSLIFVSFAPLLKKDTSYHEVGLWILKILIFKLMLMSGIVKLTSGDETWRNLTALNFHYWTQPLPAWTAWYIHHLPEIIHKISTLFMFVIELIFPFFIFLPGIFPVIAFFGFVVLQVMILLTGSYNFFNLLTLLLCFPILMQVKKREGSGWSFKRVVGGVVIACYLFVSLMSFSSLFRKSPEWLQSLRKPYLIQRPFFLVNRYGLFARMTHERYEIIVEGSNDGKDWKAYEFFYKPGKLDRRPIFATPHQPRLDWQMWFAALGNYQNNSWFVNFCVRLLQGKEEVLELVEKNPFPDRPPKWIRARFDDYEFSSPEEKKKSGNWWVRKNAGLYLPPISLK